MFWGRGRGKGRGGFGGGFRGNFEKQEPFEIFPEIEVPDPKLISKEAQLVASYFNFQKFWKNSAYHLGDGVKKQENESLDIERYSDSLKQKNKTNKKGSFYDFLLLRPDNFPKDLLGDTRRERPGKRAKWTQDKGELLNMDIFDKLIQKEEKDKAEGKEDKEEDEEEDEDKDKDEDKEEGKEDKEEDEEEEKDDEEAREGEDSDSEKIQEFDDDDDDYNQEDDGDVDVGGVY